MIYLNSEKSLNIFHTPPPLPLNLSYIFVAAS